jgi:hypothetical protein
MVATTATSMPFLAALLPLLVVRAGAAPSEAFNSINTALPGCQPTCGSVDIPYPFGVGKNCSRDEGFEITCKGSTPFLEGLEDNRYRVLNLSVVPNVALVELPIAYQCYNASGKYTNWNTSAVAFNKKGVYRISNTRNELVIIGCNTNGYIRSNETDGSSAYSYSIYTGCVSYCTSAESTVNGQCAGVGCCRVDIPPGLTDNSIAFDGYDHTDFYSFSPCSYGFLVGKDNYTFHQDDLQMDNDTKKPVWLDWAIRPPNGSKELTCAEAAKDRASFACKAPHITCKDALNASGPGYSCECAQGYEGNPYVEGNSGCASKHAAETHISISVCVFDHLTALYITHY